MKVFLGIDDQKGVAARSNRVIIGVVLDDATARARSIAGTLVPMLTNLLVVSIGGGFRFRV